MASEFLQTMYAHSEIMRDHCHFEQRRGNHRVQSAASELTAKPCERSSDLVSLADGVFAEETPSSAYFQGQFFFQCPAGELKRTAACPGRLHVHLRSCPSARPPLGARQQRFTHADSFSSPHIAPSGIADPAVFVSGCKSNCE